MDERNEMKTEEEINKKDYPQKLLRDEWEQNLNKSEKRFLAWINIFMLILCLDFLGGLMGVMESILFNLARFVLAVLCGVFCCRSLLEDDIEEKHKYTKKAMPFLLFSSILFFLYGIMISLNGWKIEFIIASVWLIFTLILFIVYKRGAKKYKEKRKRGYRG